MAWPWKDAPNHLKKDVQAENHSNCSELDRVCWLLWLDEGRWGFRNCFLLFTQRQQLLIILTRSRKEKRIDWELVSSLPATPPLETRSVLTLVLDGRLATQEPLTWASQPGESRDQRTWRSSTSSSGTWTRTRTTRRTVRTQRLSILAPTAGVRGVVVIFGGGEDGGMQVFLMLSLGDNLQVFVYRNLKNPNHSVLWLCKHVFVTWHTLAFL